MDEKISIHERCEMKKMNEGLKKMDFPGPYRDVPDEVISNILSSIRSRMPLPFRPIDICYRPVRESTRIFHLKSINGKRKR